MALDPGAHFAPHFLQSWQAQLKASHSCRQATTSTVEVAAVANEAVTSVVLSPEEPGRTLTFRHSADHRQALKHFLASVVGCSQQALWRAAAEDNVRACACAPRLSPASRARRLLKFCSTLSA